MNLKLKLKLLYRMLTWKEVTDWCTSRKASLVLDREANAKELCNYTKIWRQGDKLIIVSIKQIKEE